MAAAADARDLHALQVAVNDAAAKATTLWTSLVIFSTYLAITTGTVTHRHLLLETPIKLPILNVDLPLIGYFSVGPVLLIIFHLYVLIVTLTLVRRVTAYENLLASHARASPTRALLRQRLDLFIALLAGSKDQNDGIMGTLLPAIAWLTMAAGIVVVLVQMQLSFLPYHLEWVTWEQRACIILDMLLIWLFWSPIRGARRGEPCKPALLAPE